jgi:glycosyltransferase involved in cell wall biosynthesis
MFVGPDEDNIPIEAPWLIRHERLTDQQLRAAYAGAVVFCLMSESESFGMVYLEAWAQECPVIGSNACRPVAALIENGVDGFLCDDNPDHLANRLIELIEHPARAFEMGRRGRARVEHNFTQKAYRERLVQILEE